MSTPLKQSQYELIKEIRKYIFSYALIFPIPIFIMKLVLGGRSQLLSGGLHLKSTKLVESGFKYYFPTISSFLMK